jgi:hypothetical protein
VIRFSGRITNDRKIERKLSSQEFVLGFTGKLCGAYIFSCDSVLQFQSSATTPEQPLILANGCVTVIGRLTCSVSSQLRNCHS